MTDIKPVAVVRKPTTGGNVGIGRHVEITADFLLDDGELLYDSAALAQAREEGRIVGMREAAVEISSAIKLLSSALDEVEAEEDAGWSPAAKSGLRKIRVAYSAITRASEGK